MEIKVKMSQSRNGKHVPHQQLSVSEDHTQMVLDGTKIQWHLDRVEAWERGELIAGRDETFSSEIAMEVGDS